MDAVHVKDGDVETVVTVSGTIDIRNVGPFEDALRKAAANADSVLVDLRKATFLDTAAVRRLAQAAVIMQKRGKRMKVTVALNSHPDRVIKMIGFDLIMNVSIEGNNQPPDPLQTHI